MCKRAYTPKSIALFFLYYYWTRLIGLVSGILCTTGLPSSYRKQNQGGSFFQLNGSNELGVPQGSILGLIFFLLYFNSILKMRAKMVAFANDFSQSFVSNSAFDLSSAINMWLCWYSEHRLRISSKTKIIHMFLPKRGSSSSNFTYHDPLFFRCKFSNVSCSSQSLKTYSKSVACIDDWFETNIVSSFKYYTTIDENLKWSQHINVLRLYLRTSVRAIYTLRRFCFLKILKMIPW